MSQEAVAVVGEETAANRVVSGAGAGTTSTDSETSSEGGWIVVEECVAQEARGPGTSEAEARARALADAEAEEEAEACMELKKRVWQARICQRKSAKKIAEAEDLDEKAVEALTAEVEAVRNELGVQWTWFEEELKAGAHDERLLRRPSSQGGGKLLAPPGSGGYPSVLGTRAAGPGKKGHQKHSPVSSAKSTPKLKPKAAPTSPSQAPVREVPERVAMPPPEVWLAAKEHRKSNFFAAAVLGEGKPGGPILLAMLRCVEASSAIDLGLSSRGFAAALLVEGAGSGLWRMLGYGEGRMVRDEGRLDRLCEVSEPIFAGDPAFRIAAWARHRCFFARVGGGLARPALLAPVLPELAFTEVELGPFLAGAGGLGRLLVCDGRQTFHVVDVQMRNTEGVVVDRFHSRTLRSSLGTHPVSVTASWPAGPAARKALANGVLAARPAPTRGAAAKDSLAAFQWLELPDFEAGDGQPSAPAPKEAAAAAAANPSSSLPTTPELAPSAAPAAGAKPKQAAKGGQAGKAKPAANTSLDNSLLRASVSQERVAAALGGCGGAVEVDAVWPLPGCRVLLLVREAAGSPPQGPALSPALAPARSPATGPARSPGLCPARSPGLGPSRSPPASPVVSAAAASPQVGPGSTGRRQDGAALGLSTLELPGLACQAPSRGEEALPHGGRWWLQVWEAPASTAACQSKAAAAPELLASAQVPAKVTSIHAVSGDALEGSAKLSLLLGLASGGAELRLLQPGGLASPVRTWPAAEASGGAAVQVLLRDCRGVQEPCAAGTAAAALVAQAGHLALHDARGPARRGAAPARCLPAEGFESSPRVNALKPVGACGFAVCSDAYVYAFAVEASGGPPSASLLAAVRLPALEGPTEGLEGPAVRYFQATPYEFVAVLDASMAAKPEANAICGLWPEDGLQVAFGKSTTAQDFAGGDGGLEAGEEPGNGEACRCQLQAWTRGGGGDKLREVALPAVCLNRVLFSKQGSPPISTIALHEPEGPEDGASGSCLWGRGLLAAAALGVGVAVVRWGVEASPELDHYRELRQKQAAEEARQRERESMRRQLQRLQQRLQETERLEERLRASGPETLTEEELAKLQRRAQVEHEIERLTNALGLDDSEASGQSEEEEAEDRERSTQAAAMQKRREKEKQQKEHAVHKRDLQKERRQNRDRKFQA